MDGFHKTANTINGVVINIHGDSHSTKVGKRVRREASFRVPPPPSFNGSGRASSPTLSSNSGSPYPNLSAPPMNSVPVENARARAIQAVEFYNSNVMSSSGPNNNSASNSDTYKSLGDVFGINAAVSSINNNKMAHAQSVSNVYKHVPLRAHSTNTHAHHRVSTYSNVSVPVSTQSTRFGSSDMRASYNEQRAGHRVNNFPVQRSIVYKSNSSLDLDHEVAVVQEAVSNVNLNSYQMRQFGSQGSINDLKSFEGPAAVSTLQRRQPIAADAKSEASSVISDNSNSPKSKKKIGLFNGQKTPNKSLFKKFKVSNSKENSVSNEGSSLEQLSQTAERQAAHDDRHRRRFFSHYDIGSLCASLNQAKLKSNERKNTHTGASAASAALRGGNAEDGSEEVDHGDHVSNDLVLSCPYFRNEVGGEIERSVALSRALPKRDTNESNAAHMPSSARGFNLMDSPDSFWKNGYCPYESNVTNGQYVIERIDSGATFYKNHFYGQDHQNWFGMDENLGAVAISLRREKVPPLTGGNENQAFLQPRNIDPEKEGKDQWMYRVLVRTSDLLPLRGCVLEESIPALRSEKIKALPTKEVLEFVCPEIQLSSLHLGIQSGPCEDELIRLDEAYVQNKYKVGLMYCRNGQQTEEEMYNNEDGGPAFNEFLDLIGSKVRLKNFAKYKAGLCNKNDSTGLYSVYAEYQSNEMMFHVSTLLPFTPNNKQQLPRKRYIGNDIVTVVFQEPEAKPFIPNLKSQFQHVFIVVRALKNGTYSVAVSRAKSVPMFGPPLPAGGIFKKDKAFADFLHAKIINAENAAHLSDKFVSMAIRTRKELLKDLASNYITATTLESGHKFSLFPSSRKKEKTKPRFTPDCAGLKGSLSWRVVAEDCSGVHTTIRSQSKEVDAILGISPDSIVLIQDNTHHDNLFLTATTSVVGWTALQNSIRIYYHQGEAIILHSKDWESEDMSEISQRLKAVTNGAPTQEFTLRRNTLGQLGFHVQADGLITEVENFGYAWQTGLRQGSRLVEICKHPVTALTHEQMVDLLKTSMTVIVTVIPPHPDGSPRKGCHLLTCNHAYGQSSTNDHGDYENINNNAMPSQQQPSADKTVFDQPNQRSLSPPRSSNSSGYGTGSSRKSSYAINHYLPNGIHPSSAGNTTNSQQAPTTGSNQQQQQKVNLPVHYQRNETMTGNGTSSSAGNSGDERWYDFGDVPPSSSEPSPPPLPNRLLVGSKSSAFQKVNNTSNVVISGGSVLSNVTVNGGHQTSSSNNSATSSPSIYQHPPPPKPALINHHSNNSSSPKKVVTRKYSYPVQAEEKREAKVTYLTEFELNNQPNLPLTQLEQQQHVKGNGLNHPKSEAELNLNGRNNHRYHMRSEDELSAVSTISASSNMSPHSRRRMMRQASNATPSSGSSRTESPRHRTQDTLAPESQYGVVKLKKSSARLNPNRNSASFQTSTLQEDLMKLIGQDFENVGLAINSKPKEQMLKAKAAQQVRRSKSRETLTSQDNESNDINFMARPATVISNTSGSSASNLSGNSNNMFTSPTSPNKRTPQATKQNGSSTLPLPDSHSMDWNSLVNTATKAINTDDDDTENLEKKTDKVPNKSNTKEAIPAEERLSQLLERLESLEYRLNTESRQKSELADEVAQLREENHRLQEESATAAQQLRRFTEWFFQTIEKA